MYRLTAHRSARQRPFAFTAAVVAALLVVSVANMASAQVTIYTGTVFFAQAGGNISATGFTDNISFLPGPVAANFGAVGVDYQFYTGAKPKPRVAFGPLIATNFVPAVPFQGFTGPGPAIPAGVSALNNSVDILFTDAPTGVVYDHTISWYNSALAWGAAAGVRVDPAGAPGITASQSWHIANSGVPLQSTSELGTIDHTVHNSNFDLTYTPLSSGVYEAVITGNDSYIDLSGPDANTDRLALPDGLDFGTVTYNPGSTSDGTVDFSAIGYVGSFHYDAATNMTSADSTSLSGFNAPEVVFSTVPEPGATAFVVALLSASSGLLWQRRHSAGRGR